MGLAWQSMKHNVCKHKTHDRERPNYENYPPWSDISVWSSIQSPAPIPQSSNPDLLRSLHNASSESPSLSSCALKLHCKKRVVKHFLRNVQLPLRNSGQRKGILQQKRQHSTKWQHLRVRCALGEGPN